jgi:hypothetical protein
MCVSYAIWQAMVLLHVQNSLTTQNVANAEGGIKQIILDLNAPIVLVWATLKNVVRRRMEGDLLLLQITWRCQLMMKKPLWQSLNRLCGAKNNIFSRTKKVFKHKNLVVAIEIDGNRKKVVEEGIVTQGKFGNDMSTTTSKILTHFFKCKISFSPLETILTILDELEHLEGLVMLARRRNDEETQQVMHISSIDAIPAIKKVCVDNNHKSKTLHLTMEV